MKINCKKTSLRVIKAFLYIFYTKLHKSLSYKNADQKINIKEENKIAMNVTVQFIV